MVGGDALGAENKKKSHRHKRGLYSVAGQLFADCMLENCGPGEYVPHIIFSWGDVSYSIKLCAAYPAFPVEFQ